MQYFNRSEYTYQIEGHSVVIFNDRTLTDKHWHIQIDGAKSPFTTSTKKRALEIATKLAAGQGLLEVLS